MWKILITIFIIALFFSLSGCQEMQILIEFPEEAVVDSVFLTPEQIVDETSPSLETSMPTSTVEPISTEMPDFDSSRYFFSIEALPKEVNFIADDEKTLLVSYLESPGSLFGVAHVREYESYPDDIFVAQNLIQCPIAVQPNMLLSGHHGQDFHPTTARRSLGEKSVIYHLEDKISYRFYQNNMMVVIDLRGSHPFVTEENAYLLAKSIYGKLPEDFPISTLIESPSLDYQSELSGKYFRAIEFVSCHSPHIVTDPVVETELGYCFRTDIVELILNLKVGIYDKRYEKLVYMKEFLFVPQMGEWVTGLFFPVWGYGWQHFHEGEYEALFWVDDQLVEVIPYTLVKEPMQ